MPSDVANSAAARDAPSEATRRRRRTLSATWAILAIGWSLVRALVAWAALGDYGLNPWAYLVIDVASGCVDAVTTPRMVIGFIDRDYRSAARWGLVSAVAFVVPDLYLLFGTGELPRRVLAVLITIIVTMTVIAVVSVVRRVSTGRAERAEG